MSYSDRLLDPYGASGRAVQQVQRPDGLFPTADWSQLGKDKELTEFLKKQLDPDGSKYGDDLEALKSDFLNKYTRQSNSVTRSVFDWAKSGSETLAQRQLENLAGRLYETAPNRLFSGDAKQAFDALGSGLAGAVVDDLWLNVLMAPATLARAGLKVGQAGLRSAGTGLLARESVGNVTSTLLSDAGKEAVEAAMKDAAKDVSREAVKTGIKQGAIFEGVTNAGLGAVGDIAQQGAAVNRGLQEDVSLTGTLGNAALGGLVGTGFGAAGGFFDGRQLGRELTRGIDGETGRIMRPVDRPEIMAGVSPENGSIIGRSAEDFIKAKEAEMTPGAGVPGTLIDAKQPSLNDLANGSLQDLKTGLTDYVHAVLNGANESKSKYTKSQLITLRDSLDKLSDPEIALQRVNAELEGALAAKDTDLAGRLRARRDALETFVDKVKTQGMPDADTIVRQGDDAIEPLMDLLRASSPELLAKLTPDAKRMAAAEKRAQRNSGKPNAAKAAADQAPTTQAAASPAEASGVTQPAPTATAAPAAPTTPDAATGAAPTVTISPDGTTTVEGAAPTAAAETVQVPGVTEQVATPVSLEKKPLLSDLIAGMDEKDRNALKDLSAFAEDAGTTADDVMEEVRQSGDLPSVAKALAEKSGASAASVQSALNRVAGAETKARAAAEKSVAAADAPPGDLATDVAEAGAAALDLARKGTGQYENWRLVNERLDSINDNLLGNIRSALDQLDETYKAQKKAAAETGGKAQTRAETLTKIITDLAESDDEMMALFKDIDLKKLAKRGADEEDIDGYLTQYLAQRKQEAINFRYAHEIGSILPDAFSLNDFEVTLKSVGGMPDSEQTKIIQGYRGYLQDYMLKAVATLGPNEARARFGKAFDELMSGDMVLPGIRNRVEAKMSFDPKEGETFIQALMPQFIRDTADATVKSRLERQFSARLRDFNKQIRDTLNLTGDEGSKVLGFALEERAKFIAAELSGDAWLDTNPDLKAKISEAESLSKYRKERAKALEATGLTADQAAAKVNQELSDFRISSPSKVDLLTTFSRHGMPEAFTVQGSMFPNPVVDRINRDATGEMFPMSFSRDMMLVSGRSAKKDISGKTVIGKTQGVVSPALNTFGDGYAYFGPAITNNPAMLYAATKGARREILMAGILRASWRRMKKAGPDGKVITTTEKEWKGLMAEQANARMEAQRWASLRTLVEKFRKPAEEGGIDGNQFEASLARLGSVGGRPFNATEVSVVMRMAEVESLMRNDEKVARDQMKNLISRRVESGESGIAAIADLMEKVQAAREKNSKGFYTALDEANAALEKANAKASDKSNKRSDAKTGRQPRNDNWFTGLQKTKYTPVFNESAEDFLKRLASEGNLKRTQAEVDQMGARLEKLLASKLARDSDEVVAVKVGDEVREIRADIAVEYSPTNRDVIVFGQVVGKAEWAIGDSYEAMKKGMTVTLKSGKKISGIFSGYDMLKSEGFTKDLDVQAALRGDSAKTSKADPSLAAGDTVTKELSRTSEEDAARQSLAGGVVAPDDLNESISSLQKRLPAARRVAYRDVETGEVYLPDGKDVTIRDMIGGNFTEGRFVVGSIKAEPKKDGTIPKGTVKAGTEKAAEWRKRNFAPLGKEATNVDASVRRGLDAAEVSRGQEPEVLRAQRGPVIDRDAEKITTSDGRSLKKLKSDFDSAALGLDWNAIPDRDTFERVMGQLDQMAQEIEKWAPHGFLEYGATREVSFNGLNRSLSKYTNEERELSLDLLRRLDTKGRNNMPYFFQEGRLAGADGKVLPDGNAFWSGNLSYGKKTYESAITLESAPNRQSSLPGHVGVAHEVAHWAFNHMLTPTERMEFLRWLGNAYDDSGALKADWALSQSAGAREASKLFGAKPGGFSRTNELFAWKFTEYYLNKVSNPADELPLWKKLTTKLVGLLEKMLGKKNTTPPELVSLFERIMPSDASTRRYDYTHLFEAKSGQKLPAVPDGGAANAGTPSDLERAIFKMEFMEKADDLRSRLMEHISSLGGTANGSFADDLQDAGRLVFGLYYGKIDSKWVQRLRLSQFSREKLNNDSLTRELFTVGGEGGAQAAIRAFKDIKIDGSDAARIAFEKVDGEESFGAVMKSSGMDDPEVRSIWQQSFDTFVADPEKMVRSNAPKGVTEDQLKKLLSADRVELARTYANIKAGAAAAEKGMDLDASMFNAMTGEVKLTGTAEHTKLTSVAKRMADLLSDTLEGINTGLKKDGYLVQKKAVEPNIDAVDSTKSAKVARKAKAKPQIEVPETAPVANAEAAKAAAVESDAAVTGGTSHPLVEAAASRVTHRDKAQKEIIDTLFSRIVEVFGGGEITNEMVSKITGIKLSSGVNLEAPASSRTEAYKTLRDTLRGISEDWTNGTRDAWNSAHNLTIVLSRLVDKNDNTLPDVAMALLRQERGVAPTAEDKAFGRRLLEDKQAQKVVEHFNFITAGNGKTKKAEAITGTGSAGAGLRAFRNADGVFVGLDHTVANWHLGNLIQKMSDESALQLLRSVGVKAEKKNARGVLRSTIFFQGQGADGRVVLRQDAAGLFSGAQVMTPELASLNNEITKKLAAGDATGAMDALRRKQALLDADPLMKDRAVTPFVIDNSRLLNLDDPSESHLDSLMLSATRAFNDDGEPVLSPDEVMAMMKAKSSGDIAGMMDVASQAGLEPKSLFKESGFSYVMDETGSVSSIADETPVRLDEALNKIGFSKTDGSIPDAPTSSELGLFLALGQGERVDIDSLGLQQRALQAGAPGPIAKVVSFITRKDKSALTKEAFGNIRKFSLIQLGGQADRLRKVGATWLADIIEPNNAAGFEATLGAKMAADLERMINMMDEAGNLAGFGKRTLHAIKKDLSVFGEAAHHIPQTSADQVLIDAMRKGDSAVAALPKELRAVALEWRKKAAELLERQRDVGIGMGDITTLDSSYYLPQRLNVSWIAANPEEAVKRFARWMAKDSGDSIELTTSRARRVVLEAISREDLDGMLSSTSNVYAESFGGKLFARQFNFEPGDWELVGPMFDNNLRSLMTSYVKHTNRSIESAKNIGIGAHALRTYTDVGARGYQAALDALMGKSADLTYVPKQDSAEVVEMQSDLFKPLFRDVRQAAEAMDRVMAAIKRDGAAAAAPQIEILSRLYEATGQPGAEHFSKRAEAIVHGLMDFGSTGSEISDRELRFMSNVGKLMNGKAVHKVDLPRAGQRTVAGLKTFNSITLLSMSVLASISDMGGSLMRTGDFNAYVKGVAGKMKAMAGDPDYRSSLLNIGAGIESILQENVGGSVGGTAGRLSNAFFNGIGLTQWTRANRDVAALVAYESIRNNAEIAKRLRAAGQQDTVKYRRAVRHLREVGLAKLIDEPTLENMVQATAREDISAAIHKIANESVFQPNRMDIPVWAQDPLLSLLWQFKSYPQQMFKAVKRNISEMTAKGEDGKYAGDLKPMMFLLTTGTALGAGGLALKDVVQGRNDVEDNPQENWRSFRERRLSKMVQEFGFKDFEMDNQSLDAFAGWYLEALLSLGTLGFVGDLAYQTARNVDDGAFGRERVMSQIAGPWLGTFTDALKAADGLSKVAVEQITGVDDEANSDQRAGVRAVLGRVPVLGSQRPIINPVVDYLAGEKQVP